MKFRLLLISTGLLLVSLAQAGGRQANATAAQSGITISPAFQMVTVASGSAEQPVSFKITNNRPVSQSLSFAVRDFNTLNESGGLFFVGTNPTALQKKYGLAKWIELPAAHVDVAAGQTIKINASVLNLPDLSPGGHYGALMISLGNGASSGKVGLQPIASSLLFVTKPEGATHDLSLSNVNYSRSLFKLPSHVSLRFQNTGNTHVVPRGSVYVKDSRGKLISKGIINEASNVILPQTFRRLNVQLNQINKPSAVGKYNLRVDFRIDGLDQFRGYQASFWHVGAAAIIVVVVVVLIAAALAAKLLKPRLKSLKKLSNK